MNREATHFCQTQTTPVDSREDDVFYFDSNETRDRNINLRLAKECGCGCDVWPARTNLKLPSSWPCQWNNGVIPFAFDFFALSPKRLTSLVHKAHAYIEARSCLVFKETNPVDSAREFEFTYLFYTYSEVLESCCLRFYTKNIGRRLVLITPTCFLQVEVAHATLHALGLDHPKTESFNDEDARAVMYPYKCKDMHANLARLEVDQIIF